MNIRVGFGYDVHKLVADRDLWLGGIKIDYELGLLGYESYWNYAEKKGYSGTAIYTKHKPLSVSYDIMS